MVAQHSTSGLAASEDLPPLPTLKLVRVLTDIPHFDQRNRLNALHRNSRQLNTLRSLATQNYASVFTQLWLSTARANEHVRSNK